MRIKILKLIDWFFEFFGCSFDFMQQLENSLLLMPNIGSLFMSIRLFWQISRRRSISLGDFSTQRGALLAGDSYWSRKRR